MLFAGRLSRLVFAVPLVALVVSACGGDDDPNSPGTTGTIEVTTVTSGTEQDPDGYTVQIDGASPMPVGNAGTVSFPDIAGGAHTVQLGGLAENCTVAGENPRSISVTAGATASVSFAITCTATTGGLGITAATTGSDTDPDGYTISVDGVDRGPLGVNATVTLGDLAPGVHEVGLNGVAANCQIEGENVRSVAVGAAANASVSYAITCAPPPPGAGDLRITTVTTGPERDRDGYIFAVDDGTTTPIAPNDTTTLQNVAPGEHSIQLAGLSGNCSVQGTNPKPVTVTAGATAELSVAVTCQATTGMVRVSVATTGSPADPDGYVVKLDAADPGKPVTGNGTVSFTAVRAGSHVLELSGLAATCGVTGESSKTASVTAGATAEVSFAVTCEANTGSILVTTVTSGAAVDPDGYTLSLDGNSPLAIGVNSTTTLTNVTPGEHSVTLAGIAPNCTVSEANPSTLTVTIGAEAPVAFTVTCTSADVIQWTLVPFPAGFTGVGVWASSASDVFVVGSTSGNPTVLHYDGSNWAEQSLPSAGGQVSAVWGTSPTDVYAAGGTHIWHYNGTGWTIAYNQGSLPNYLGLGGTGPQDVYAVGWIDEIKNTGLVEHYNGSSWSRPPEAPIRAFGEVYDVSGTSPSDVYIVGRQDAPFALDPGELDVHHQVLHYDGTNWSVSFGLLVEHTVRTGFTSVWATARNSVFVVGLGGDIWRFDGTQWSTMTSPTSDDLLDLWGSSGSDVFAVGNAGILRYDGTSWSVIDQTRGTQVWGAGTDVFVLTEGGVLHGTR